MKIVTLGTSCVDVYPQKGKVTPGGEALNAAVHISLLDEVQVYLMGLIGKDSYGDAILNRISHFPLNKDYLYRKEGVTANHVIYNRKDGDRYFTDGSWDGGVRDDFRFSRRDLELVSCVDGLLTTASESELSRLVDLRKEHSFLLAVDFADRRDFSGFEEIIEGLDIFFLSAQEEMKADFLERSRTRGTLFVLTFGSEGSAAYHKGREYLCPGAETGPVVDTTGCGDCYQGVFLAEYIGTGDIDSSMRKAAARAAEVTAYVGGTPPEGNLLNSGAVFLIRHGESMGNLTGDYSTSQHDNLSPLGREQARILAENLSKYSEKQNIGTIVCSPLGRARQTIAPYLENSGLMAQIWADLAECCWQDETDAPLSEPEQSFHPLPLEPDEETLFTGVCDGMISAPSEKESYRDGLRRMERTAGEIQSLLESGGGPVFVVCHAFCIGKLIHFLTGEGDPMAAPDLVNTSVTKLILHRENTHFLLDYFDKPACFL